MYRHFRFANVLFRLLVLVSILATSAPVQVSAAAGAAQPVSANESAAELANDLVESLQLELQAKPEVAKPGDKVTYKLSVTNSGAEPLTGLFVNAVFVPELIYSPTDSERKLVGEYDPEGYTLRYTLGDLQPHAVVVLTFKAQLAENATGDVPCSAYVGENPAQSPRATAIVHVEGGTPVLGSGGGSGLDAGWQPLYNPPVVSSFSGAATYNYGLELPPGRNGLQPNVNLGYSSRGVDGTTPWVDSEWVGMGWSIDTIDIMRRKVWHTWGDQGNYEWIDVSRDFNLAINGTSYRLTPADGVTFYGRYYAENAPELHVELHAGSNQNYKGDYWTVRTPGGTVYRLGYTSNSEQKLWRVYYPPYDGPSQHQVYRWRVDQVTDSFNNSMVFDYYEHTAYDREYASYLANIWYNSYSGQWASRVEFVSSLAGSDPGQLSPILRTRRQLDSVRVYHLGQLLREYAFTYETEVHANASVERRLTRIRPYGAGGVAGGQALPQITFTYQDYNNKVWEPHQEWCNLDGTPKYPGWETQCAYWCEQFPYPRLVRVDNGYGGMTAFTYSSEIRNGSEPERYYAVIQGQTWDGVKHVYPDSTAPKTTYDYVGPCWDSSNQGCDSPGEESNALVGFSQATERHHEYNGAAWQTLSGAVHQFDISNYRTMGRETQTRLLDGADILLQQADRVWNFTPGNNGLVYLGEERQTDYSGGVRTSSRVAYTYDDYANPQATYQYGAEEPVVNAGFEGGSAGWELFGSPTPASITTTLGFAGRSSLQLQGGSDGGASQAIAGLVAGESYVLRARVKWASLSDTARFQLALSGGPATTMTPSTTWSEVTLNFIANATGQAGIQLTYLSGSGTIYVDEVALARAQDVGDERSTHRFFFNLTDNNRWLIGLKWGEYLFAGITPDVSGPSLKTQTIWYYDDYTYDPARKGYTEQITRGLMTMMGQGLWATTGQPFVTTRYGYDLSWGTPISTTDPNGNMTTTTYDSAFHLFPTQVCQAAGTSVQQCSQTQYYGVGGVPADNGLSGQVKRVIDPNGADAEYRYDSFGRLVRVWRPGEDRNSPPNRLIGYSDVAHPDWHPLVISIIDKTDSSVSWNDYWAGAGGVWTRQLYDGLGRTIQTQKSGSDWTPGGGPDQHDIVQYTVYDALGRAREQSVPYEVSRYISNSQNPYRTPDPNQLRTVTLYDALGRTVQVVSTDGSTTTSTYTGRTTRVVDANGHWRDSIADAFGQLMTVREYKNGTSNPITTTYKYNALGNLTQTTDSAGNVITMTYDALGRKTWMSDPDMGKWYYGYDAAGNTITQTDALSQTIVFTYDPLNRPVSKRKAGGEVLAGYTYDAYTPTLQYGRGQRTGMADASGSANWTYDLRGRVTAEVKQINGFGALTTTYTYDALDRVATMTYPDGETVVHHYDNQGLLDSLARNDGTYTYVENVNYNAMRQETLIQLGGANLNLQTSYAYNNTSFRLEHLVTTGPSGALQDLTYAYDAVGNVRAITDTMDGGQVQHFGYDALDRLVHAWTTGGGQGIYDESYAYDGIGNMIAKGGVTYTYDPNHPHAVKELVYGTSQPGSYAYDANGNMLNRNDNGAIYVQRFDVENRLASVTTGFITTTYVYDGDGKRVKRVESNGDTTAYVGDYYEVSYPTSPIKLVTGKLTGVGSAWQTVTLPYDYASMVVVASPSYESSDAPAVTRVRNASGHSFQIKVQNPSDQSLSGYTVHYLVVEEGVYNQAQHGVKMEAKKYLSTLTDCVGSWSGVFTSYRQSYTNPVVLGQVMTANDADWSVFWARGSSQGDPPRPSMLYTGKHVGEDSDMVRANETIGYIVIEAGSGSIGGVAYVAGLGPDTVRGFDNNPPFYYAINGPAAAGVAIVSATAMDGGEGGWPVLYGDDAVSASQLKLAFDEDQVQDAERSHTSEQVPYIVFAGAASPPPVNAVVTKYYYAAGQKVAMRIKDGGTDLVYYLHGDHLGSTSLTTNASGAVVAQQRYAPYGEVRWVTGTLPTDLQFTGQRREQEIGLYDYNARFYDPFLGRFISADTIVPQPVNPQTLNRYAYALGNPLKYTDPTGHYHYWNNWGYPDEYDPGGMSPEEKYVFAQMAGIDERTLYPWNPYEKHENVHFMPDAMGLREEASAGHIVAGDVNLDLVLSMNDQETGEYKGPIYAILNYEENLDLLLTVGGQAITEGAAATAGPFVVYGAKSNKDLEGWSVQGGATGVMVVGAELNASTSLDLTTQEFYLGFGGGGELSLNGGVSYTFNVTDIATYLIERYLNSYLE